MRRSSDATRVSDLPPVDERLADPQSRCEVYDGEVVVVAPADEPHGQRHSKIAALVEAHAAPAFDVACDMLTRTSLIDDVAPDVSVYPAARDPAGRRQIEQLAFEVVSTERLSHAARKAGKLAGRGVRRVFAIDVERGRALEWSVSLGTWGMLDSAGYIEDPALAAPLPIEALVRVAKADDAMARALIFKRNPVIEAMRAESRDAGVIEGKQAGLAEAVLGVLAARGLALAAVDRARILAERDPARLGRWIARAATCATISELFAA
jgi:Uma2 family endonuclease